MAQNKKSFVLYSDVQGLINKLPDDVAGRLFKHIFAYVNDENPVSDDILLNVAFEPIKMQLKRDLVKWENQIEQRRQAGIKSAESRKRNATTVNERSISSTDNVNVNDINNNTQPKVAIDWDSLLKQFNEKVGRNHKVIPDKAKKQLLARLKEGYTKQDIWNAIQNCYDDEFHKENNHKYLTLEFISRADKMERYSVDVVKQKKIDKSEIGKL
jgi:uncharacterized phage protein (TIGR02220 family)